MARKADEKIVRMKDVAKRAGVSQATVSYVLNRSDSESIAPETRERVEAAARELGYRPNVAARSIRTQRTNLIGFVSDRIAVEPFAGATIEGAQDAARAHDRMLLLVNTGGAPDVEHKAVETLLEHRVEGIIFATFYHRQVDPPPSLNEIPAVLLDCFTPDQTLHSVVPDEVGGGYGATEALLKAGHRRIAFINGAEPVPATAGRLQGYRQALADHGIAYDPGLVRAVPSHAYSAYDGALELFDQPDRPTALFCYNDRMAMGAYDALKRLGLMIPRDVAVVGFDNQEIIAAALHPGLSTMQLPHYQMGDWAVRHLLGETPEKGEQLQKLMACPYVARDSV